MRSTARKFRNKNTNMNKQIADFNKIQFINGGKGLDTVTLKVRHDKFAENQILINGIECTWCGTKEWESENHPYGDLDMCDSCYEGMVA